MDIFSNYIFNKDSLCDCLFPSSLSRLFLIFISVNK
nr:MAG TPA: hypothetical protein [Caudoviricetes sp.]